MSSDTLLMNGGNNGTLLNGNAALPDYGEASSSSSSQPEPVAINSAAIEQTYDSLFPALPEGNNFGRSPAFPQWSALSNLSNANGDSAANGQKIMKVRSSKVTEHFTLFCEEKRELRRICADIAKETNTDIEITNTSKGLTFLISGELIV